MSGDHDELSAGPSGDWPGRLLAEVSARTPIGRSDWGRAMLAELEQVEGFRARWTFAAGSARAMLLPALAARPGVVTLTLAGASLVVLLPVAGPLVAFILPGTLAVCVLAALAPPGSGRVALTAPARAGQVFALGGVLACLLLAVRLVTFNLGLARGGWGGLTICVIFAAELLSYVLLLLRRPEPLGAGRYSGIPGLLAALATGATFLVSQPPGGESDNPVVDPAVIAVALAAPVAAAALAAALEQRGHSAPRLRGFAAELLWAWLLTGPVVFIALLLATTPGAISAEAADPGIILEAHQQGATNVLAWVAGDDLGGAVVVFTALYLVSVLSFLVGNALSQLLAREASSPAPRLSPR
jgi:hypothetical protein